MNLLALALRGCWNKKIQSTVNVHTKCETVGYGVNRPEIVDDSIFFIELLSFCIYFPSNLFYVLFSILPSPDSIFLASGSNEICAHKRNCLEKKEQK